MTRFRVRAGSPLEGRVEVAGATKNSGVKQMAAALLAPGVTTLRNMPSVLDLDVMSDLLRAVGATVDQPAPNVVRIDAEESYRIGLCDRLVDEADLESEVTALAAAIAAQPPMAVQGAKRAVDASDRLPVAEGLVFEAEQQRECLRSADMREAITALVEQRAPVYKGN